VTQSIKGGWAFVVAPRSDPGCHRVHFGCRSLVAPHVSHTYEVLSARTVFGSLTSVCNDTLHFIGVGVALEREAGCSILPFNRHKPFIDVMQRRHAVIFKPECDEPAP